MLFLKHMKEDSFVSENTYFVKKGTKLEYTEEEKSALAVFILVIVFSIIEMILAAAIAKSSHQGYRGSPLHVLSGKSTISRTSISSEVLHCSGNISN